MNELQSKINAAEARIHQLKNSELFNEADRLKLLPKAEKELEQLLLEKATDIVAKSTIEKRVTHLNEYNDFPSEEDHKILKALWERNGSNRNSI